jgi:hypothetical protein
MLRFGDGYFQVFGLFWGGAFGLLGYYFVRRCGSGYVVTIPDEIVEISSFLKPSFAEFAQLGLMGYLPVDICSESIEFISTRCGCASTAVPSILPPTTLTPS